MCDTSYILTLTSSQGNADPNPNSPSLVTTTPAPVLILPLATYVYNCGGCAEVWEGGVTPPLFPPRILAGGYAWGRSCEAAPLPNTSCTDHVGEQGPNGSKEKKKIYI